MSLPPIRSRILQYLSTVEVADVSQVLEALRPEYGKERQFTRKALNNHLMSLKENELIEEVGYEIVNEQLETSYCILAEGQKLVSKYMKKWASK